MIRQKQDQYKSTGVWDMFALPGFQEFYNGLVNLDHGDKRVHYSALFVNKTIIATHVGLIDNDTFYYIMPSYKGGDWKKYSSGRLLLENLLEWAIENHLEFFDFTVGDESYKKIWCDMETKLYETLRSFTFKGRIYILIQYFSRYMKKIPWFVKIYRAIKNWLKL